MLKKNTNIFMSYTIHVWILIITKNFLEAVGGVFFVCSLRKTWGHYAETRCRAPCKVPRYYE
eukprot:UN11878